MRKPLALILALCLCTAVFVPSIAEDNSGVVLFFDDAASEASDTESVAMDPQIPDNLERAVIGDDDRVTIANVADYPYSAIAYMEVTADCGCDWTGTGFVCGGDDTLITAAHCLVCPSHGAWARKLTLYFGYRSRKNYLYKYDRGWTAYVGDSFRDGKYGIEKDWGVIRLDEDIANVVGCFGSLWNQSDEAVAATYATVAGYRDFKLTSDSGYMDVMDESHVTFLMDEESGNSGGPIFTEDGNAVGIIIAEAGRNGEARYNIGYRLTGQILRKIEQIQEN